MGSSGREVERTEEPVAELVPVASRPIVGEPRITLVLRLAKALHRYGIPAHRLEAVTSILSARLGLRGYVYSSPTAIFGSFGDPAELRTAMIRVEPGETDLGRLVDLDALTSEVMSGERTAEQGLVRLEEILSSPPIYHPALGLLCVALVGSGASFLLGGQLREMIAAVGISLWLGPLLILSGSHPGVARVTEALGAFGAAVIAVALTRVLGPFSTQTSIVAGLIPLLPGLAITVGMTELATRNLVSGTTRFTGAILTLMQLVFGVALGSQLDRVLPAVTDLSQGPTLPAWTVVPALLLATGATAVLFRAKPRDLIWVVIAGVLSFGATRFGSHWLGSELGAFVGSLVLCMASNAMARTLGKPAILTIIPGLILLVPGSIGFRSLDALRGHDPTTGIGIAFSVGLIAMSIVTGLLVANLIVPPRKVL